MAARPRTLPAAIAPVLVGSAGGGRGRRRLPLGRVRRRADRLDLHPDRHQPRQRLLRRQARRRHRRPARPGAGHLRRAGGAAARPLRDLARVRRRRRRRHLPGDRRRPGDPRGRRRLDRRRRPLHRAARAPTATRAWASCSSSCSSAWSPSTAPTTSSSSGSTALPFWLSISVGLLSTAILVVNNVRDLDTDRRAGKRTLAVRLGRERTRALYVALRRRRLRSSSASAWSPPTGPLAALLGAARRAARDRGRCRPCSTRTDGPALNGALAGTGALLAAFSVLVAAGLLIARLS